MAPKGRGRARRSRSVPRTPADEGAPLKETKPAGTALVTDARFKLVPVRGMESTSREFQEKVVQIAERLGTNPNFLMAVMSFETGGTFSPSVRNQAGSGAVGLIQFMPRTAQGLGLTKRAAGHDNHLHVRFS
jgi:soluble lytic murein transglycosylase-like protein